MTNRLTLGEAGFRCLRRRPWFRSTEVDDREPFSRRQAVLRPDHCRPLAPVHPQGGVGRPGAVLQPRRDLALERRADVDRRRRGQAGEEPDLPDGVRLRPRFDLLREAQAVVGRRMAGIEDDAADDWPEVYKSGRLPSVSWRMIVSFVARRKSSMSIVSPG
jgi:hypothetical protein